MKVLVTGATGFIGTHVLELLGQRECEIHAVSSKQKLEPKQKHVNWHIADLLKRDDTEDLIEKIKPDHLLHLAWFTKHSDVWNSSNNLRWTSASLFLAEKFIDEGGKRIVFSGTCGEYDWKYGYCKEYETPENPWTFYGRCKLSFHSMLDSLRERNEISYANGRIFFVYGPGEFEGRLVADVISSLLQNKKAKCSHGFQIRDYLHVYDVAAGLVELLFSDLKGTVNIASGEPMRLRDIIGLIGKKLNKSHLIEYGKKIPGSHEPPVIFADTNRITDELGMQQDYNLDKGISETIKYWKNKLS